MGLMKNIARSNLEGIADIYRWPMNQTKICHLWDSLMYTSIVRAYLYIHNIVYTILYYNIYIYITYNYIYIYNIYIYNIYIYIQYIYTIYIYTIYIYIYTIYIYNIHIYIYIYYIHWYSAIVRLGRTCPGTHRSSSRLFAQAATVSPHLGKTKRFSLPVGFTI